MILQYTFPNSAYPKNNHSVVLNMMNSTIHKTIAPYGKAKSHSCIQLNFIIHFYLNAWLVSAWSEVSSFIAIGTMAMF